MSRSVPSVALDTHPLYTGQAGVARYVRGLMAGFRQSAPTDFDLRELGWAVENFGFEQPVRALKTAWRELAWAPFIAPLRMKKMDVMHHTFGPLLPMIPGPRHVMTLCDLALVRHPERYRDWHRRAGLRRLQRIRDADRIICISQFTADEAMALLGVPAKQIEVVHLAPTLATREEGLPGLPTEFYLFVGSLEPGKNLSFLKALWQQHGGQLPALVIVGARWAGVPAEGPPPANWHYLGHQGDEVLLGLYRRARALLFPSLYEGFGLPPLEAMAAGCPVICAPRASMPEVVGDAARLVPLVTEDWFRALAEVERERANWQARGAARAGNFSWRKCAEETAAVYRAVLAG